jgi:hypothetical protein
MMQPGALKYGGLGALLGINAPKELFVHRAAGTGAADWLSAAYDTAGGRGRLRVSDEAVPAEQVVDWLLR